MKWKLATFNVNGIRARMPILLDWLAAARPDVLCLQETKVQDKDFPSGPLAEAGYQAAFWGQKSYNGVAVLTRSRPERVIIGFGDDGRPPEEQARIITVEVDGVTVINTYVPQGREVGDPAFQYKLDFFQRLEDFIKARFSPDHQLIWTGDVNVAPSDRDVFDPQRMEGKVTCHPDERAALERIRAWGVDDVFRLHHPEEKQFTFWDYRLPKSFQRDLGWRIDHIYAARPLARACTAAYVDSEPRGWAKPSDHAPMAAEFDLDQARAS